jgi:hypothetical protein
VPTVTSFTSVYSTTTDPKTVTVTGAAAGDYLFVLAVGDENEAATNVSTATISTTLGTTGAWATSASAFSGASADWIIAASAQVVTTSSGSVTVQVSRTVTVGAPDVWGFYVLLAKNSAGIGNVGSTLTSGSTRTASLTTSANSAVAMIAGDWDAAAVGTFTPASGATQIERAVEGASTGTFYGAWWASVSAGTVAYGVTGSTGAHFRVIAVEILDVPVPGPPQAPAMPGKTWKRRFRHPQTVTLQPTYPLVETLIDDFTVQDNVTWTGWGANVVWNARGTVDIAVTPSYFNLASAQRYSLTGSSVYAKIFSTPPIVADNTSEMHLVCIANPGVNEIHINWTESGGVPRLFMRETVAGVSSDTQVTMDPSPLYMRIRESAGSLFWETSPDTVNWTVQRTKVTTLNWSSVTVAIMAGYWGTVTGAGTGSWDSVNALAVRWLPSFGVPYRMRRRPRLAANRVDAVQYSPPQVPVNPSVTQWSTGRIGKILRGQRRGETGADQFTPPQIPVAPPITQTVIGRVRQLLRAQRRADTGADQFTPPQAPVNPVITQTVIGRVRQVLRAQRRADTGADQFTPPQIAVSTNPSITQLTTGRVRQVVRAGVRRFVGPAPQWTPDQAMPLSVAVVKSRRPLRFIRKNRVSGSVVPQEAPAQALRYVRRGWRFRRGSVALVTPPQQAATANPSITATTGVRGRLGARALRRGRVSNPTPAQQVAPVNPSITQLVGIRGRLGARALRRGRVMQWTPAQQAATPNPSITQLLTGRLRRIAAASRRARVVDPTFDQDRPLSPREPARHYPAVRHGRAFTPIPGQQAAPTNPSITQTTGVRGRLGARALRRGKVANPTPAQVFLGNPVITALTSVGRLRSIYRRQPRPSAVTPVARQVNPPYPMKPSHVTSFKGMRPRGHSGVVVPVPPQDTTPARVSRQPVRGIRKIGLWIRGLVSAPVPPPTTTLSGPIKVSDSSGTVYSTEASASTVNATESSSSSVTSSEDSASTVTSREASAGSVTSSEDSDDQVQP